MPTKSINETYLQKGLTGLSNASNGDWFYGHFGASVLAGEFLINECELRKDLIPLVQKHIDKFIERQPKLFKEINDSDIEPDWEEKILGGLRLNLERLRTSGHGVIFGTLALKAFKHNHKLAKKNTIEKILKLLQLTSKDRPSRYYGIPDYDSVKVEPSDNLPVYKNELDLIRTAFFETEPVYPDQTINNNTYFFTGCKIHGITHGHALCILSDLGYTDLAKKGFENHRLQMKLNRHKPPDSKKLVVDKIYSVRDKSYWERDLNDTHYVKFPYSVLSLLKHLPNDEQDICFNKATLLWSD